MFPKSTNPADNDARPRSTSERLQSSTLEELWSIWQADPRVPSVRSRHSWAIARNASPRLVDQWFLRRKAQAKKAGQPIQNDTYDIPLGRSESPITPKQEQFATLISLDLDTFQDLPSDDMLLYPADADCANDQDVSSDTVFDEDTSMESKALERPAYKEAPQEIHHQYSQQEPRSGTIIFPHTIDPSSISFADLDASKARYDSPSFDNTSFLVCNQDQGKQPGFTCVLCSSESAQDMTQPDSRTTYGAMQDPFISCPRLDFSSTSLSELSAIPFLFRTPPSVPPNSNVLCQNTSPWTSVEEELSRLVHNGELDFSFLDVPQLSSLEFID